MKLQSTIFLDRPEGEIEANITGKLYRGNPRDVDDPSEIDDLTAHTAAGDVIELNETEVEQAEEALLAIA
jgi:hypothetical protein